MWGALTNRSGRSTARRHALSIMTVVALASSAWSHASAGPRAPYHGERLPFAGYYSMLSDPAHKKVFVSSGTRGHGLAAFDLDGRLLAWFDGLPAVEGMVVYGDNLYALLPGASAISVIDIPTLKETREIPLQEAGTGDLVVANGHLWYVNCAPGDPKLVSLDPENDFAIASRLDIGDCPHLRVGDPEGALIVAWQEIDTPAVSEIDVSGPLPVVARQISRKGYTWDLAVSPDNRTIFLTDGDLMESLDVGTFALQAYFMTQGSSDGRTFRVAVSPDGRQIALRTVGEHTYTTVYDVSHQYIVTEYQTHSASVTWGTALAFDPVEDGKTPHIYALESNSGSDRNVFVELSPSKLDTRARRAYRHDGHHYLFHVGVSPVLVARLRPVHRHVGVMLHVLYRYPQGIWEEVGTQRFYLDDSSRVAIRFPASLLRAGDRYALYMRFPGDGAHRAARSHLEQLRITR